MIAAALTLLFQTPSYQAVPFKAADDAIIANATVNGKNVSCLFDTGFSGAFILGEDINVGKPTGKMMLRDFVGEFAAQTVPLSSVKVGDISMDKQGMEIVQQPTGHMTESYNTHTDGIMGLAVMAKRVFQINFEKQEFRVFPDSYDITKVPVDGKRTVLAKMLPTGHNSIELLVDTPNGNSMTLALDTGNAFFGTTHRDVLEDIGLWTKNKRADFMGQAGVASGAVDSYELLMQDLTVFGVPVKYSTWSIIDAPSSSAEGNGTVGYQFLKNFNITVDMKRRRVLLEAWKNDLNYYPEGSTGILGEYVPELKRVTVYRVLPGSPADKGGIKPGDTLLSINGKDTGRETYRELQREMKGPKGTKVAIAFSHRGTLGRVDLVREFLVNGVPDGFSVPPSK